MDQRLTIITLGVADVKRATSFYEEVFGWNKSASGNENISFFHLNGIEFALYGRGELAKDATVPAEGSGFKGFTLAYNARSEKEVDELFELLGKRGANIVKKPGKVFWGGYSGYMADPDDNLWEIAYNPFLELDDKGATKES
ncbi:MAG TPA: VOC family protein [Puia sp.]|nr:VOC family protein [Puia sp.]